MHLEHWQSFRRTYISFLGEYRAGASLEVRKELVEEGGRLEGSVKGGYLVIPGSRY